MLRQLVSVPSRLAEVILRYRKLRRHNPFSNRHLRWDRNTHFGRQIEFAILHLTAVRDLASETQPTLLEHSFTDLRVSPTEHNIPVTSPSPTASPTQASTENTTRYLPTMVIPSKNKIRIVA